MSADPQSGGTLAAALTYAEQGWPVFPCKGKLPRLSNGFKGATRDTGLIRGWWSQWPDASIGIPTGAASGLVVLDIDPRNGGNQSLLELLERHKVELPETRSAKTGGGGAHFYFALNGTPIPTVKLAPGLDRKGEGGYVIAPNSPGYEWTRTEPLAQLPHWLANGKSRTGNADAIGETISEGGRNATLTSLAGTMRRRGMSETEILAALQVANETRCVPPLASSEVERIAGSVARYAPTAPSTLSSASLANGVTTTVAGKAAEIVWGSLADVEMKSIRFADRPFFQYGAFHLVVGEKNAGKGTFLSRFAADVTNGKYGESSNVIWIVAGEDSLSIDVKPRILAAGGDPNRVTIVRHGRIRLPQHVGEVRTKAQSLGEVGLIVFDPIGGNLGAGKSSNADTDIREAIAPLNELADELDAIIVGVRHLGKDRSRGALAAVLGGVDWVNVPRAVLAIAVDDDDEDIRHVQVIAGNRAKRGESGRSFRIEGIPLPGLTEPVTRAITIGTSGKDVESLLALAKGSRTGAARTILLDILDAEGEQESDSLDARVAQATGAAIKTVKNTKSDLKEKGLLKFRPEKDAQGKIVKWFVSRSNAPRPDRNDSP
jgi:Bifunctional DNA primase/polymerase, N-terminal/AAA domain/Primase C terminal 1 (PriCT-1)